MGLYKSSTPLIGKMSDSRQVVKTTVQYVQYIINTHVTKKKIFEATLFLTTDKSNCKLLTVVGLVKKKVQRKVDIVT